jgi:hypothetical protein
MLMMSDLKHLVWDTCVFGRYLTGNPADFVGDIESFMSDVRRGLKTVYYSSAVLAEIGRPLLTSGKPMDILEFSHSLGSNFVLVEAGSNIMALAGALHAERATNPNPGVETNRVIGLGDAIHLATALFVQDMLQGERVTFHTLDKGRGSTWEKKCVPPIGLERWFPEATRSPLIQQVCGLTRAEPLYPQISMNLVGAHNGRPNPDARH